MNSHLKRVRIRTMYLFLQLVVASTIPFTGIAQYQKIPQVSPIPPNAAAMFKVLERPLGSYTGTIPVSFPLGSISSGKLTANLSLDYNSTGGIRVEEQAGSVGLGFSLNDGGGRVVQMIRDKDDLDESIGRLYNPYARPSNVNFSDNTQMLLQTEGYLDLEADVFMYNINGKSGKFYLKENGDAVPMQNDGMSISFANDSWTIIDEEGNKYLLGQKVSNISSYTSGAMAVTSKSWHLNEVTDINGQNTLTYTYTLTGTTFNSFNGSHRVLTPLTGFGCAYFDTSSAESIVLTSAEEAAVSRIDGRDGYILIDNYQTPYVLRRVRSISFHDPSGNLLKRIKFNYSNATYRMKLSNFSEFDASLTDSLTHRFEYNHTDVLPSSYLSHNVDIWGYYNGVYGASNSGLTPNLILNGPFGVSQYLDVFANRTANAATSAAEILKKITYPTGGYREFVYEGNRALASGDFFTYHPSPAFLVPKSFSENGFVNNDIYAPSLQKIFKIEGSYTMAKFSYTLLGIPSCALGYQVKIYQLLDSTDMYDGILKQTFTNQSSGSVALVNGHYRVDVVFTSSNGCSSGEIRGSWSEGTQKSDYVTTPYGNFIRNEHPVGGVRIKEIRDYDPVSGKTNKIEYKYKMYSLDSTLTSGLLVTPINIISPENPEGCGCNYYKLAPGTNYPLAAEGGSYVVYPEVRTIESGNGRTDTFYSYAADITTNYFPMIPPYDMSTYRGEVRAQRFYNQSGVLLKQTTAEYTHTGTGAVYSHRMKALWVATANQFTDNPPGGVSPGWVIHQSYPTSGYAKYLWKTTDTTYSSTGAKHVITKDYLFHNYNNYYALKQEKQTVNNSKTKETNYRYAFNSVGDFSFGLTSPEQTMKTTLLDRHYLQPLEISNTVTTSGGSPVLLGGAKYSFGLFHAGVVYPTQVYLIQAKEYTSASDFRETIFSKYDTNGNLLEKYLPGGMKEAYLWGFNTNYPVAKIAGSDHATVNGWITQAILNSPASDGALRTHLNTVRTNLAGTQAQVSTYTYKYGAGLTSQTDAKGMTLYYEYDNFQRLKLIKDTDGNIVKTYKYNYKP